MSPSLHSFILLLFTCTTSTIEWFLASPARTAIRTRIYIAFLCKEIITRGFNFSVTKMMHVGVLFHVGNSICAAFSFIYRLFMLHRATELVVFTMFVQLRSFHTFIHSSTREFSVDRKKKLVENRMSFKSFERNRVYTHFKYVRTVDSTETSFVVICQRSSFIQFPT